MSAITKLVRSVTDRIVARIGDEELVAAVAAERAAADAAREPVAPSARTLATKGEVMSLLGIKSPRTIESMVKAGTIPADAIVRVGRCVRFDVPRLLEALRGAREVEGRGAAWARRRSAMRAVKGGRAGTS